MRCLIVDDEVLAQEVIEHYISKIENLVLAGKCNNAVDAFTILSGQKIDLMFLDIKMPEISGLDFIKTLKNPPKIILTTAFPEYALDGYELDVADYLLKPIAFERFMKAVNKVTPLLENFQSVIPSSAANEFYVKSDRKLIKINPDEILFIESKRNYLMIHMPTQKILTYSTLNNMEDELKPFAHLIRVHKSFMVNKNVIFLLENSIIKLNNNVEVPIGANYRDDFIKSMRII